MDQKEWTIMVYMAGDNNLAVDMAYAMDQIKGFVSEGADSPNLFVYYDGKSPLPTLYCDFSDPAKPRYVRSFKVSDKLYPVPAKENENGADRRSVLNFVDWCVNKVEVENGGEISYGRRARKYAMIFSGHSLGFQDIGLFRDESSGKTMKMTDLHHLLQRLVNTKGDLIANAKRSRLTGDELERETTELLGKKLDVLGFDSCVMGMLEVGYQFGDVAMTMIASEGSVPTAGWPYSKILKCFAQGNGTEAVTQRLVSEFIKSQDSFTVGGVSVDMAAWDLSRLPELAIAFDELSEVLIECFEHEGSRIYRQMERVILQVHWKCQSYMYDQNIDLGDFCELLDRECGLVADEIGAEDASILEKLQRQCRKVLAALEQAVILSGFSGGAYQYSNGMSVFFPWSREGYEVSRKNYESLRFAKDATNRRFHWTAFLKKYLNEVALRKFEKPRAETMTGSKYRYFSGIRFDEPSPNLAFVGAGSPAFVTAAAMTTIPYQPGTKISGQEGSKIAGQEGTRIAGQEGSKIAGQEGSKIAGQEGSKIAGQEGSKIAGQEGTRIAGQEGTRIAGQEGSKIAGQEGTRIAGQEGTRIAGQEGSKIAGQEGSKIAGQEGSKIAGQEGSKIAGQENTKIAGQENTKIAGHEGTKISGQEGSKIAGQEGSKIAGQEGSKIAGQEGSKLAGQEGSDSGQEGLRLAGGGSNAFFDNLRLFKNIESRWNISGFTKRLDE